MIDTKVLIKESKESRQAHLKLEMPCLERGGNSTNHKGVLAQYLDSTIPSGRILLCHACDNGKCSNPLHLYWGTDKENIEDAKLAGTWKSFWDRQVDKYGYKEACAINKLRALGNKGGGSRGKPLSEEHKRNISKALTKQK